MTLSITTFSIMTFCIAIIKRDTQHNGIVLLSITCKPHLLSVVALLKNVGWQNGTLTKRLVDKMTWRQDYPMSVRKTVELYKISRHEGNQDEVGNKLVWW
jgi:hypothetical protein